MACWSLLTAVQTQETRNAVTDREAWEGGCAREEGGPDTDARCRLKELTWEGIQETAEKE